MELLSFYSDSNLNSCKIHRSPLKLFNKGFKFKENFITKNQINGANGSEPNQLVQKF